MRATLTLIAALGCASVFADDGYVVKVDGDNVVVDLTAASGSAIGRKFFVYTEGEELKHPATGKSLGRMEQRVGEGEIRETAAQYSVGAVTAAKSPLAPGQRVRWLEAAPTQPPPAPAPASQERGGVAAGRQPAWRSPFVQVDAVDLDVADVDGDGKRDVVLAGGQNVQVFPEGADPGGAWQVLCAYQFPETGAKVLSVEASDLDGDGKAEVFATFHNDFFDRVETAVLACKPKEGFQRVATLPWMVRSVYGADGRRILAAQALVPDRSFPFGAIYPLGYEEGKYRLGSPTIRVKRLDWIYSVARTGDEKSAAGNPLALFYDYQGRLRAQFKKGAWSSPEALGQTSNRIRWKERLLKFSPRLPTIGSEKGLAGAYAVRNIPKLGGLADAFGAYGRGEIQRLKWNGLGLEREWVIEADGYVAGIASSDEPGTPVYAAVVNANGSTAVFKYTP